jgi:hypothetical protein
VRIFLIAALVCLVLSLVCLLSPTTIVGAPWQAWLVGALLSWCLDQLLGSVGPFQRTQ